MKDNITFILELTKRCNNNCLYCYNVWKGEKDYPKKELTTEEWKNVIDKIFKDTKPALIGLSGGEPLLNKNLFEILDHLKSKNTKISLITNGTLLNKEIVKKCHSCGVRNFELPLLGDSPEIHDKLTRNPGSWKRTIKGMKEVKKQHGTLTIVLVIVKQNIGRIKNIMELAIALGADIILANRFNVGGEGIKNKELLSPTASEIDQAFKTINNLAEEYEIPVSSGIPVPPCTIDISNYNFIKFAFCPRGKKSSYYAVDPSGNIRPCNHSSLTIGNLLNNSVSEIFNNPSAKEYFKDCPTECKSCKLENECGGSCRAASEVYFGDNKKLDPFVSEYFNGIIK